MKELLRYGGVPVPYPVLWSGEDVAGLKLGICQHAKKLACCNAADARGSGKPIFGTPHMGRQREVIINDLCDLCAKPLKGRTKVSLSHAGHRMSGTGLYVMQVEPMVHKDCGAECVKYCPALKKDIRNGTLFVRHVLKHRSLLAIMTRATVKEFCGQEVDRVVGHAKVELLHWKDRDFEWLTNT